MVENAPDLVLCHGRVYNPEPGWHGHAWVETSEGRDAIDPSNGHVVVAHQGVYYRVMHASEVTRYSKDEAIANSERTGHYGPWVS